MSDRWVDYSASRRTNRRTCANCGNHVGARYARVMEGDDRDRPQCCPKCPDLTRDADGTVREHSPVGMRR